MENITLTLHRALCLKNIFTCIISLDPHLSPIKYMDYHCKHLEEEKIES